MTMTFGTHWWQWPYGVRNFIELEKIVGRKKISTRHADKMKLDQAQGKRAKSHVKPGADDRIDIVLVSFLLRFCSA